MIAMTESMDQTTLRSEQKKREQIEEPKQVKIKKIIECDRYKCIGCASTKGTYIYNDEWPYRLARDSNTWDFINLPARARERMCVCFCFTIQYVVISSYIAVHWSKCILLNVPIMTKSWKCFASWLLAIFVLLLFIFRLLYRSSSAFLFFHGVAVLLCL